MEAVSGTYENGTIRLDKRILSQKKMKVIVTFLEDLVSRIQFMG